VYLRPDENQERVYLVTGLRDYYLLELWRREVEGSQSLLKLIIFYVLLLRKNGYWDDSGMDVLTHGLGFRYSHASKYH